ncbi:MAG: DUF5069 domain-containing protein [Opitutales bacterium]|nr:DUF5069 domain-containing protein [Opitutales bacterium]
MNHDWQKELYALWGRAVLRFRETKNTAESLFAAEDRALIDRIGATPQEVFDFVEDFCSGGDPDFTTFALLADIRRHYFLEQQGGRRSGKVLDIDALPAKSDAVEGIEWLPRIIPKALAKLRGELHPDIMYLCGGDRAFFRRHDIHPAEFLRIVETHEDDPGAVVRWVVTRSAADASEAAAACDARKEAP